MKKQVQSKVKKHIERYGSITDLQCWNKYQGRRLSSVINRLRKEMPIDTVMIHNKKEGYSYAQYKLRK